MWFQHMSFRGTNIQFIGFLPSYQFLKCFLILYEKKINLISLWIKEDSIVNIDGIVNAMVFPLVLIWLWEVDRKEGGALKNWCLRTVVLEKTPERPLDSTEIKLVNHKGNQPWILLERIDDEVETPVFWSSHVNNWFTGKIPDAGKDWG